MLNAMTKEDNIIMFPKPKRQIKKSVMSDKHKQELKDLQAKLFTTDACKQIQDDLFHLFNKHALKVDEEKFQKDFAFVMDSIKSLILRDFDVKHPLQNVVDEIAVSYSADGRQIKNNSRSIGWVQMFYDKILLKSKLKKKDLKPNIINDIIEQIKKNKDFINMDKDDK